MWSALETARLQCLVSVFVVWSRIPAFVGIPSIAYLISAYADPFRLWGFGSAMAHGHAGLVLRLHSAGQGDVADDGIFAFLCNARIDAAARDGDLETVERFVTFFSDMILCRAPEVAAANRHLHILSWLYEHASFVCWGVDALRMAGCSGHVNVLRWLDERFPLQVDGEFLLATVREGQDMTARWIWVTALERDWPVEIFHQAISEAPLALATWFFHHSPPAITITLDYAASRGDLKFLRWAHTQGAVASSDAMDSAAATNRIDVLDWLQDNRAEGSTTDAMDNAAAHGHVAVLEWLRGHQPVGCTSRAFIFAARGGHLRALQWLMDHYPLLYSPAVFDHAAGTGRLHILQWLSSRTPASTNAMDWAAASGHLAVVEWLHENRQEGCTFVAMDSAAAHGHLDIVLWLHEHRDEGCSSSAMDNAAAGGHLQVLRWLHEHRQEGATSEAMDGAASGGFFDVVRWLHNVRSEGCTYRAMNAAAAIGNLELLAWLHDNRVEGCTNAAMDDAVAIAATDVLQFLRRHRGEGCTRESFRWAVCRGNLHLARWLVAYFPHTFDARVITAMAARFGWTPTIIQHAFTIDLTVAS